MEEEKNLYEMINLQRTGSGPYRLSLPSMRNQLAATILLNEATESPLITEGTKRPEDEKEGPIWCHFKRK